MTEKLEVFKKELLKRMKERDEGAKLAVKVNKHPLTGTEYLFQMTSGSGQIEYFSVKLEPVPNYIRVFYV